MKRYKKSYRWFFPLLAGMLLFLGACTKEDFAGEGGGTDPGEDKEKAFVSVSIRTDVSALNGGLPLDAGTPEERRVQSVRMVLYEVTEAADTVVKYAFDFGIKTKDDETGFYEQLPEYPEYEHDLYNGFDSYNRFITYARKVDRQDYLMMIILNPTVAQTIMRSGQTRTDYDHVSFGDAFMFTNEGCHLYELMNNREVSPEELYKNDQYGFAVSGAMTMVNSQGLIPVAAADLGRNIDEAHEHPIPVDVERIVAKVKVAKSDAFSIPDGAAVGELKWNINNINRWMYFMRKLTYKKGGWGNTSLIEKQGDTDRGNFYAYDPNFIVNPGQNPDEFYERNFQKLYYPANFEAQKPDEFEESYEIDAFRYILENTMAPGEQVNPEGVTSVVVGCEYTPDPANFPLGTPYFVFNNISISVDNMRDYANGTTSIPAELDGLDAAITAVKADDGFTFTYYDDVVLGDYVTIQSEDYFEINTQQDLDVRFSFDKYGIRFYRKGVHFYTVPIRHFDVATTADYGRYGVVRNNVYDITIRSIQGPGSPIVIGDDPRYISAGIKLLPWASHGETVDLGDGGSEVIDFPYIRYNFYHQNPEYGDPYLYFGSTYDSSVTVGSPLVAPGDALIAAMKAKIPPGSDGTTYVYKDGVVQPFSGNVSSDNSRNVIDIYYDLLKYQVTVKAFNQQKSEYFATYDDLYFYPGQQLSMYDVNTAAFLINMFNKDYFQSNQLSERVITAVIENADEGEYDIFLYDTYTVTKDLTVRITYDPQY